MQNKKYGHYVIAYDLSSNDERSKVNRILKGFGFRVQMSVFESVLKRRDKEKLKEALGELNIQSGFVKMYKLDYHLKNKIYGKSKRKNIDNDFCYVA